MKAIADDLVTIVVFGIICVFLVFKFRIAIKNSSKTRAFSFWLSGFCFGVGLMLRSSHIYPSLDALVGINNISWYLGRIFFTSSVFLYTFGFALSQPENPRKLRWMTYGLFFTLSAITFFFWRNLASADNYNYSGLIIPVDRTSLIINLFLFLFASLMLLLAFGDVYRLLIEETVLSTKIRWFFIQLLNLHGTILFSSRLVVAIYGYFFAPVESVLNAMSTFIGINQALIMFWPLVFLSSRYYDLFFSKPITYIQKLLLLRDLITLKHACEKHSSELFSPAWLNPITPWQCIRYPDMCIYKILIALLDYKSSLSPHSAENTAWLRELSNIDDNVDYQGQLKSYSQLGRKLRQQRNTIRFNTGAQVISLIFHPIVVSLVMLSSASYAVSGSISKTIMWSIAIVAISFTPTIILIARNIRQGIYRDHDVSVREQRHGIVLLSMATSIVLIITLSLLDAPRFVLACIYAGILGFAIAGLINRFVTKISGHAFGNAYCTAIILTIQPAVGLIMIVTTLLVGWSRFYLRRHTPVQVVLGSVVGFLCVPLVFWLYLGEYGG